MLISLVANSDSDVMAIKDFIASHPDIKEIEPSFTHLYDADGNFKEIPVHLTNLPTNKAYLKWYLAQADAEKPSENDWQQEDFETWYKATKEQIAKQ
jgi:hypothetical protein